MNNDLISRSALTDSIVDLLVFEWGYEGIEASVKRIFSEIPAVDAGPNWISVEDKLPEKSGDYLAFTEKGIFMVLSYSEIHRAFNAYDWCENITPIRCTHWMPLPEVEEHD